MSQICVRRWGSWHVCADESNLRAQRSPLPHLAPPYPMWFMPKVTLFYAQWPPNVGAWIYAPSDSLSCPKWPSFNPEWFMPYVIQNLCPKWPSCLQAIGQQTVGSLPNHFFRNPYGLEYFLGRVFSCEARTTRWVRSYLSKEGPNGESPQDALRSLSDAQRLCFDLQIWRSRDTWELLRCRRKLDFLRKRLGSLGWNNPNVIYPIYR